MVLISQNLQNINIKYISGHITFSFGLVIITEHNMYIKHYTDNLPPTTKLGQGNIFTGIFDSVHRGEGVCLSAFWDTTTPQDQAPPGLGTPWNQAHPPGPGTPPGPGRHPPEQSILGDTVNERAVCILLECNLVFYCDHPGPCPGPVQRT